MAKKTSEFYGTGRRKSSTARVFLRPGVGQMFVNNRPLEEYFTRDTLKMDLMQPLVLVEGEKKFDATITVKGGGSTGQAGAIRLGIARALLQASDANRAVLKPAGLLTRDARRVERKKYGQAGARRRFQFSKR